MDQVRLTADNAVEMSVADVNFAWQVIEPLLLAAVAEGQGEWGVDFIQHALNNGYMKAWAVYEKEVVKAVVVTEIVMWPNYRVLRVVLLAGRDMDEWIHLDALLETHARRHSCAFIEGFTRPGMAKRTEKVGYRTVYHVIRKHVQQQVH